MVVSETVTRRIVKPDDCVLLFGIPTTEEGFRRSQENKNSDFSKRFYGGWIQYYDQFAADFETVAPSLRECGVKVVQDATLDDFSQAMSGRFQAIILFSHWHNGAVEFRDGMETADSVLEAVPTDFPCILDLCVCHPLALVNGLRRHRPKCIPKHLLIEAKPHYWLYFYRTLFRQAHSQDLTYLAAIEEVACAFLDAARPVRGRLHAKP